MGATLAAGEGGTIGGGATNASTRDLFDGRATRLRALRFVLPAAFDAFPRADAAARAFARFVFVRTAILLNEIRRSALSTCSR